MCTEDKGGREGRAPLYAAVLGCLVARPGVGAKAGIEAQRQRRLLAVLCVPFVWVCSLSVTLFLLVAA